MSNQVLQALRVAKKTLPSLRIGQIIQSTITHMEDEHDCKIDLFYLTNDRLTTAIIRFTSFCARGGMVEK